MNIKNLKIYKNKKIINKNLFFSIISFGFTAYFSFTIPFYRQNIKAYNLEVTEINDYNKKTYNEYVNKNDYENIIHFYDKWYKIDNVYKRDKYSFLVSDINLNCIKNGNDLINYKDKNIKLETITSEKIPETINEGRKIIIYNIDTNNVSLIKEKKVDNLFNTTLFIISSSFTAMYITNYRLDTKEKRLK